MTKRNQHVIPRGDQWAVRGAGARRDTELFDRKQDAVDQARGITSRARYRATSMGKKSARVLPKRHARCRIKSSATECFPASRKG